MKVYQYIAAVSVALSLARMLSRHCLLPMPVVAATIQPKAL